MHPARKQMELALKTVVVPVLRGLGFKGSMPHFRRLYDKKADLLTFQFNLSGGSFVAEMSVCSQADIAKHWRSDLTLKTITAHDMGRRRRLGSVSQGSDYWFVFGKKNYEPEHEKTEHESHYLHVAGQVVQFLESQGVQWWATFANNSELSPTE
jgi:hypothetical protein